MSTCGTELLSVSASLEGIANAVRDLMVIFRSPQLDDLGSEDSRAYKQTALLQRKINRQVPTHLTWFGMTWGRVNDDRSFSFRWTVLEAIFQTAHSFETGTADDSMTEEKWLTVCNRRRPLFFCPRAKGCELFPGHTAGMCAHARCWVYPFSPCLILP